MTRWLWISLATAVFAAASLVAIFSVSPQDGSNEVDVDVLAKQVVIGTLLIGLGQLLSLASHNPQSNRAKRVDGAGKAFSLAGWAFGLVASISFAAEGTDVDPKKLGITIGVILTVALIASIIFMLVFAAKALRYRAARSSHSNE